MTTFPRSVDEAVNMVKDDERITCDRAVAVIAERGAPGRAAVAAAAATDRAGGILTTGRGVLQREGRPFARPTC